MSSIWPKFSKDYPCPACSHHDWNCRMGSKKYLCMRVQSDHPSKDGGYYHEYGDKKPAYIPPAKPAPKILDFEKVHESFRSGIGPWYDLANGLGVGSDSLISLDVLWSKNHMAWAIPMRDGDNKIIGIQLRSEDGEKRAIVGSRLGLFTPQVDAEKLAYVCEGASSTAALLSMGLYAIGRPSCNTGADHLKVAIKRLGIARIVIVADNDCIKVNGQRPGQEGAKKLKKDLALSSVIYQVPSPLKDVRQLLQKVGAETARKMIEQSVAEKIWTRA